MQPERLAPTDRKTKIVNLTIASIAAQVGCLTLIIILAAVFGGLWLDSQNNSKPMFTVGLLIASIPISLIVMFVVVRFAIRKLKINISQQESEQQKEAGIGKDS